MAEASKKIDYSSVYVTISAGWNQRRLMNLALEFGPFEDFYMPGNEFAIIKYSDLRDAEEARNGFRRLNLNANFAFQHNRRHSIDVHQTNYGQSIDNETSRIMNTVIQSALSLPMEKATQIAERINNNKSFGGSKDAFPPSIHVHFHNYGTDSHVNNFKEGNILPLVTSPQPTDYDRMSDEMSAVRSDALVPLMETDWSPVQEGRPFVGNNYNRPAPDNFNSAPRRQTYQHYDDASSVVSKRSPRRNEHPQARQNYEARSWNTPMVNPNVPALRQELPFSRFNLEERFSNVSLGNSKLAPRRQSGQNHDGKGSNSQMENSNAPSRRQDRPPLQQNGNGPKTPKKNLNLPPPRQEPSASRQNHEERGANTPSQNSNLPPRSQDRPPLRQNHNEQGPNTSLQKTNLPPRRQEPSASRENHEERDANTPLQNSNLPPRRQDRPKLRRNQDKSGSNSSSDDGSVSPRRPNRSPERRKHEVRDPNPPVPALAQNGSLTRRNDQEPGDKDVLLNGIHAICFWGPAENGVWVNRPYSKILIEITVSLLPETIEQMPRITPQAGMICAALYSGSWYRARVTSINPTVQVFFIDYGNSERCDPSDIIKLPDKIRDYPAQATLVQLSEDDKEKYGSQELCNRAFMAKFYKNENGYTIQLKWELLDEPTDNFGPNSMVIVSALVGTDGIAIRRIDEFEKYSQLTDRINAEKQLKPFTECPAIGELLLALSERTKTFQRARVRNVLKDKTLVQFIDDGFVTQVLTRFLRKIPSGIREPNGALAVWPQLERQFPNKHDLIIFYEQLIEKKTPLTLVYESNPYNGTKLLFNNVCCSLMQMSSKEPVPDVSPAQRDLTTADKNPDEYELFLAFEGADPLDSLPAVGTVVAAFCVEDQIYCRARILGHENKVAAVAYIDSGSMGKVDLCNLRPLPIELQSNLSHGVKTVMSGSVDEHEDVDDETSIDYVPLGQGTFELYIAHVDPEELFRDGTIRVMNLENPVILYIMGELRTDIKAYCDSIENKAYTPQVSELCLTYFKGVWFRAFCVNNDDPREVVLSLIDLGKVYTVDSRFIRPQPAWVSSRPAAASPCTVDGFERFTEYNFYDVFEVLKEGTTLTGTVRLTNDGYLVSFPALDQILS